MMEANRDAKYVCAVKFSVARFAGSEIKMRRVPGWRAARLPPATFYHRYAVKTRLLSVVPTR